MNSLRFITLCAGLLSAALLSSCGTHKAGKPTVGRDGKFKNPYQAGTYEHFTAEPSYPKTYNVWKNEELLSKTGPDNTHIIISVSKQRGLLMNGDQIVMDYPICSGRPGHETPMGKFQVLEKSVEKRSNRYGRLYDATGECISTDPDMTKDTIPEGGRFEGAEMRYWMRITWDGIGHHIGPVKRYPASHSCIRGPSAVMPLVFSKVKVGTPITVEE